jgi:hypothetical protein
MIWHIVRKDARLLWPYALAPAVFEACRALLLTLQPIKNLEFYGSDPTTDSLDTILWAAILLAGALMIARLSHLDAIPGVRQDWLARPISRWHLLAAKVLGLILFLHVPLFLIDALYHMANGFPIMSALVAAAGHGVSVFIAVSLPVLALCSTSRNLAEAVATGLALLLAASLFMTTTQAFHWELLGVSRTAMGTPLQWIPYAAGYFVLFVGALAVLSMQFFRRNMFVSRVLICVAWAAFGVTVWFFPWNTAFAIQTRLVKEKGSGSAVRITFDPAGGRLERPPDRFGENDRSLYIPVDVQGLPPNTVLRAELWDSYATTQSGRIIPISRDKRQDFMANGPAHLRIGLDPLGRSALEGPLNNPETKEKPFQLEIELAMTLLRSNETIALPAIWFGGSSTSSQPCRHMSTTVMSALGEETADPGDNDLQLICVPVVQKDPCVSIVLKDLPEPWVQRPSLTCFRSYGPFPERLLTGGDGVEAHAYFRDPAGAVDYFASGNNLRNAKLELHWYKPVDLFTRKIVIPDVRLKDWTRKTP